MPSRTIILLLIALAIGSIGVYQPGFAGEVSSRQTEKGRILPSEVALSNLDDFQRQVRADLPVGTEKADVEAYLTRWNIGHEFAGLDHFYAPMRNAFHARIANIGGSYPFPASLLIRIHLDANDKVRTIVFRVDALAP